ncbi:MAG: cysteine hydrolase family protein [Arenicella sp.]
MKKTALILIDIQNDYFQGGALPLVGAEQSAAKSSDLLALYRANKQPIIHIQHETIDPSRGFMLPETKGQKIHDLVAPSGDETVFTKHYPNSFWLTGLESYLKERDIQHIVLAGMMTHMCVSATARVGMERGFQVTLMKDACATKALELEGEIIDAEIVHKTALAELTLFADIKTTQQFMEATSR